MAPPFRCTSKSSHPPRLTHPPIVEIATCPANIVNQASLCSAKGNFLAVLESGNVYLTIYGIKRVGAGGGLTTSLKRSIELPVCHHQKQKSAAGNAKGKTPGGTTTVLRWSSSAPGLSVVGEEEEEEVEDSPRILVCTGTHISIYDLRDESWSAQITLGEVSSISHIDFGSTFESVLVFGEVNTAVHILRLSSSKVNGDNHLVIKNPKSPAAQTYALRQGGMSGLRNLAMLTKLDTVDYLTVFDAVTYAPLCTTKLPTVDAQGVKWSPDGIWIAVWDVASLGGKVVVCTAEGQIYDVYTGSNPLDENENEDVEDEEKEKEGGEYDAGVNCMTFSPDSRYLALGLVNGRVEIVDVRRGKLHRALLDPMKFGSIGRKMFVEQPGQGYVPAPQQETFPYAFNARVGDGDKDNGYGKAVTQMAFNADGSLLAVVDTERAHVLWIWSMKTGDLVGALIQRDTIREVRWHPDIGGLVVCVNDGGDFTESLHMWRVDGEEEPGVVRFDVEGVKSKGIVTTGRRSVRWLSQEEGEGDEGEDEQGIWYCWGRGWVMGSVNVRGKEWEMKVAAGGN